MSVNRNEVVKISASVRMVCGIIAFMLLVGSLLALFLEENWKLLISGGVLSAMFGYLAAVGRLPKYFD